MRNRGSRGSQPVRSGVRNAREPELTELISAARAGGKPQRDELFDRVYTELKAIAAARCRGGGETLNATALVGELYLELERRFPGAPTQTRENRATFFQSVSLAMRRIVHDHWRAKAALKRGGRGRPLALQSHDLPGGQSADSGDDALLLDELLTQLEQDHPRWYRVVMYRYFGGRTQAQTAELLGIAESTAALDWKLARAWLTRRMGGRSVG